MSTASLHHHGLRVADAKAASDFYCSVLGGRRLVAPFLLEGEGAERLAGVPGARIRVALVGFEGGALELFEFVEPVVPGWARAAVEGTVPHLALQVEDVDRVLAAVEAAGGQRLWPQVARWGSGAGRLQAIYVTDPDGNVVELLDRTPAELAGMLRRWFLGAEPEVT